MIGIRQYNSNYYLYNPKTIICKFNSHLNNYMIKNIFKTFINAINIFVCRRFPATRTPRQVSPTNYQRPSWPCVSAFSLLPGRSTRAWDLNTTDARTSIHRNIYKVECNRHQKYIYSAIIMRFYFYYLKDICQLQAFDAMYVCALKRWDREEVINVVFLNPNWVLVL